MSARTIGRIVGALFLLAYVVYLAGGALADAGSASTVVLSHVASHQLQISAGALLMLANSAAVIGIGVLLFPILKRHHEISAYGYLSAQVVQGVMLAVGIAFLLLRIPLAQEYAGARGASVLPALARLAQEGNHYSFWIGMLSVGVGGLLLCRGQCPAAGKARARVHGSVWAGRVCHFPRRSVARDPRPQRRRGPVNPRRTLRDCLRSAAHREGVPRGAEPRLRRTGPQRAARYDSTVECARILMPCGADRAQRPVSLSSVGVSPDIGTTDCQGQPVRPRG
jgi:hypothetical protein